MKKADIIENLYKEAKFSVYNCMWETQYYYGMSLDDEEAIKRQLASIRSSEEMMWKMSSLYVKLADVSYKNFFKDMQNYLEGMKKEYPDGYVKALSSLLISLEYDFRKRKY